MLVNPGYSTMSVRDEERKWKMLMQEGQSGKDDCPGRRSLEGDGEDEENKLK